MKKIMMVGLMAGVAGCCAVNMANKDERASVARPRAAEAYTVGTCKFTLGIAPYTYYKYKFGEILEFAKKHDLHYMGIKYFMVKEGINVDNPDQVNAITDAEIAAAKKALADAGVTASSVGPVYMHSEAQCDAAFRFTQRMGLKVLVAVPYETHADGKMYASRKLCEYAEKLCKKYDIKYAIHNHGPDSPTYFPTGRSAYELVEDLDPRMGLCLDIGHDFRYGYDPADSIRRYRDRLFDIHLKNVSDCTRKGSAMPFPRGKINMVEIVEALREIGYTGCCEIEYERDFTNNVPGMAESVGYFRGVMDAR